MTRDQRVRFAGLHWGGFYRCPTTGLIITALHGDNKAICGCGRSNPNFPQERTKETGTHRLRYLEGATAAEFVDQEDDARSSVGRA